MKKLFLIICVLVFLGIFLWWNHGSSAVNTKDTSRLSFVIDKGESTRQTGNALKNAGLIQDSIVFFLMVKFGGYDGKIQAGNFHISPSQNLSEIITTLTRGTTDNWVTIPEGLRATEIAVILKDKLPSYQDSWVEKLVAQEGYLFPDTYSFSQDTTIDQVITTMENNFRQKYAIAKSQQTNALSQSDVVTLASIVQREAITPHDMQYVASALENRLRIGMALGSDVTIEYALGYQPDTKTWWKKDLTIDDLAINSPYNTRKVAGLPPTPISNPGLTALEVVVNPPASDYLYYISDSKGVLHFAKTLEEHNANIAKYGQ